MYVVPPNSLLDRSKCNRKQRLSDGYPSVNKVGSCRQGSGGVEKREQVNEEEGRMRLRCSNNYTEIKHEQTKDTKVSCVVEQQSGLRQYCKG